MIRYDACSACRTALFALLTFAPAPLFAQAASSTSAVIPHSEAPTAVAARRNGDIQIDGKLDEAAWAAATPITSFLQFDPNEGKPVSERTEARVLIDDVAIYVGMRMFDSSPAAIQSQLARRDEPIESDLVELSFDSYHDHLTGVIFRLSPAGARRDAILSSSGNQDNSWDAVWEGSATIDAGGWSAEFRIPLSQLRFNPNIAEQVWGMQLSRKIARKAEIASWSFTPKTQQGGVSRFGHLTGLGRLSSSKRIELVPYALTKNVNPDALRTDPLRKRNEVVPGFGLDVKYGITSNLTLDATFNPDFGQVEVDPAVVNLSAFETFYPEKRPFFIEGSNVFDFGDMRTNNSSNGYTFLHSRRIGRAPQRSLGGSNIAFVDAPIETTIAAATKLTGRTAGGYSFGILDAVTMREEAVYRDSNGADHRATVEPLTNYYAGRIKRDMRQGNTTVGVATTAVNRRLDDPALEPIFRKAAYTGGLDWQHAWGNRTWAFDGNFVVSHNIGSSQAIDILQRSSARYLQRPDRESFRRDSTRTSLTGYVAEMTFAKTAGQHWRGSLTYQDYNPGFEINEIGFLGRTDMRGIAPLISYSETKPTKRLRRFDQFLFWNPTWTYDGDMTFNGVGAITTAELPNFWNVFFRADWRPPVFDQGLTRGGPVARAVSGGGFQGELSSDRRKRYTYGMYANRSFNSAGGFGFTLSPFTTLRPSTALRISVSPQFSSTHAIGQFVTRVRDPLATNMYGSRYVFATLDQKQLSMVTRVDWTFTPKLSLQIFAQPLLAAGDFQDYKEFARQRQFDFNVYGRDQGTISRSAAGLYTVDPDGSGAAPSFSFGDRDFNTRSLRGNAVLRWEYRPGSALFLVWQQSRSGFEPTGQF
nr:carbohydrate binding family 9 domain-containing protein [Gemmatimonadaceae bacterium]